uniref:Sarcosine dehydrogenase n=1 Tax=Macrostomum lignano TaxID=282301 RepID=A0A1I8HUZ5_9PLAT
MRHAYIVTERIEGIQNMPNTRDHDASVYLRLQGDALSVGGYEPNPIFIDEMPSDFAFSLYELDWDVFAFEIGGAVNRVPAIGQVGVKSTVCGPESFTPDGRPLLGEDPDLRGFYHASAYNSGGMMYSGGTARELARWIITGRPELDMFAFDVKRFRPGLAANSQWLRERSHETYAKHYSVHYHHDEPLAGRSLTRRSPLHSRLAAAGCVYQERHGFERPGWFHDRPAETADYRYYGYYGHTPHSDYEYERCLTMDYTFSAPEQEAALRRECRTCRSAGAVFDMSYFGKLMLTGPGSAEAVDYLFSADIRKPVGSTVYTCLLNERGGVEADLTVSVLEPGAQYYLAIGGAAALYVKHYLLKVMQDRGWLADNRCQLEDRSDDMTLISVQGPVSRQLLAGLVDGGEGFLSDSAFPFGQCRKAKVAGRPALMLRVSFVGELGWELHLANADAPAVYDAVMAAGKPLGVVNAGYRALDSLSCEKGYRHGHVDLRSDDTPLEAGLAFTCKLKLPDRPFIGREALERQRADGLRKRLICLTLDDAEPGKRLHGNELVLRDGQPVGFVRRAEQVYCLAGGDGDGVTMAYAYASRPDGEVVKPAWLKAGAYQVECMGERRPAKLHLRSPFDPENLRLQVRGGAEKKRKGERTGEPDPERAKKSQPERASLFILVRIIEARVAASCATRQKTHMSATDSVDDLVQDSGLEAAPGEGPSGLVGMEEAAEAEAEAPADERATFLTEARTADREHGGSAVEEHADSSAAADEEEHMAEKSRCLRALRTELSGGTPEIAKIESKSQQGSEGGVERLVARFPDRQSSETMCNRQLSRSYCAAHLKAAYGCSALAEDTTMEKAEEAADVAAENADEAEADEAVDGEAAAAATEAPPPAESSKSRPSSRRSSKPPPGSAGRVRRERTIESLLDNDELWDTDLEDELPEEGHAADLHDTTGRSLYRTTCERLGAVPVKYFLKHLTDTRLIMRHHGLGPVGTRAIARPLAINLTITELDLTGNWMEPEGGRAIAKMLEENSYITHLWLADNKLCDEGAAQICRVLQTNSTSVTHLSLAGNEIGDQAADSLFDLLANNRTLVSLNLSRNCLGGEAAARLGAGLGINDYLEELDLSGNRISGPGAVELAQGIRESFRLKKCNLAWNGFAEEGGRALADMLKANQALQELNIEGNRLNGNAAVAIGNAVAGNEILLELRMGNNFLYTAELLQTKALMDKFAPVSVSRQLLAGLVDGGEGFLSDSAFPFGQCRKAKVAGRPALMLRVSFVGELGWELHLANADAPAVYDAVMAAGKPLGVVNAGYRALDSLSCEKGYRHGHVDLRSDDTPLEAGLAFTCKLKLPDRPFIGREALERQRADGLRKRLICLTLDDAEPGKRLHGNELVLRDGQPVGFVRRAEQVYCLAGGDGDGVTMAYAYASRPDGEVVKPAWLKAGAYQVECMGERRPAKLHLRSPFDPENLRLQGRY